MPSPVCSDEGCEKPTYAHGWCHSHYIRRWRRGELPARQTVRERYEAKVDRSGGPHACHPWTGALLAPMFYGRLWANGRPNLAHRLGWQLAYGPIPEGLQVLHTCDNGRCQNPRHFFLGTNDDNQADKKAKGRAPRGERNGLARLTADRVRSIRAESAAGARQVDLAARYGVNSRTIRAVVKRETWTHIE